MRSLAQRQAHQLAVLRAWLEYVAQTAIDWLDELDAPYADLEPEGDE